MSRLTVATDSLEYVVSPDDGPPPGMRTGLLAGVRVLDELTGRPPGGMIAVTSRLAHGFARVAEGGLVGLVGVPLRAFPGLAMIGGSADFLVDAGGFVPRAVSIPVPAQPPFTPPPVDDLALHRRPVTVRGRVVRVVMGQSVAVAGASVAVTAIQRTLAAPSIPTNLVSLTPELVFDRAAGVGQLTVIPLATVLGDDKFTLGPVSAGSPIVRLSNSHNLLAGDILILDPDDPGRAEYLPIQAIAAGSTSAEPARFTFAYPTARAHPNGAVARKATPGAAGPAKSFAQDGWAGDACVFLGDIAGLSTGQTVRISGGAVPDEYHAMATFAVTCDADGYYRLPPLSRVAQLEVAASNGALNASVPLQPDYTLLENALDLVVS